MTHDELKSEIALAKQASQEAIVALEAIDAALTGDTKPMADLVRQAEGLMHLPVLVQPFVAIALSDAVLLPALQGLVADVVSKLTTPAPVPAAEPSPAEPSQI